VLRSLSLGLSPAELAAALREHGVLIRPMDGRAARVTVGRADENAALLAALTDLL
jgi:histidinol-phosphate/aromatic aminotransferase/cobyric acid decarboxylase-like protein